ncbi:MAG TPA: ribosome maturation factor RimM [Usitatibacteraceae bacterium]|nr:ribosome maturation factor RimM [Usitatibacteraceae bacterium]
MAQIGAPFGIKGWVKLHTYTESADSLYAYASWLVRGPAGWEVFDLEDFAVNAKGAVAKLKGIDDRNAAQRIVKREVGIPRDAIEDEPGGAVLWIDLIGAEVVNTTGRRFGTVRTLMETGANDVLVVVDGAQEHLIPYIDPVIVSVERDAKRITVDWSGEYQ